MNNISVKQTVFDRTGAQIKKEVSQCFNVGPDLPKDHAMRAELVALKEKLETLLDRFLVFVTHINILFFSTHDVFSCVKFRKTYMHTTGLLIVPFKNKATNLG